MSLPLSPPLPPLPTSPIALWLLMGGISPEHEVSLDSALTALHRFEPDRYRVRPVCIRRDGRWCLAPEARPVPFNAGQCRDLREAFTADDPPWPCISAAAALAEAERDPPEVAFILMHGPQGEDGRIQGLLEGVGLRYTGSGVVASALAMDKRHCQRLLRSLELPVPPFAVVTHEQWRAAGPDALAATLGEQIALPCLVKPSAAGSSVGVTIVRAAGQLPAALEAAFVHDRESILCERFIAGLELTCGILDLPGPDGLAPTPLAVTEITPREGEFFDYHCKYTPGASEEITPARIGEALTAEIQRLALAVHRAVGARGFSRVDFILSESQGPLILEINTIPGMTETSLLPQGAAAQGIDFSTLLTIMVEAARHQPLSPGGTP